MATPNVSSIANFVKKYPITLCGFSFLFMPSVYRLLLYFTPLLISTAIFIVAMMSWGPSMSSERGKRRGKRNDYAFNGSLKIYDEEEEEEGEEEEVEEVAEVSQKGNTSDNITQQEDISIYKGTASNIKPDPQMKLEPKLHEPDPDYDDESKRMRTASNSAISGDQAEPDPDLHGDRVGAASCNACSAEPDPDLHGERVVKADSHNACSAEPDPDLHAEQHVDPAHDQDSAAKHLHAAPDLPTSQHHAESLPINPDQQAAGDHLIYHDTEPDHFNYHEAELKDYDGAESNHLDCRDTEPDPDLHGECAVHAKSEEAHAENDDLHAAISELRQKLGMMKRKEPYSDDILSHQPAERLQTLQAAA